MAGFEVIVRPVVFPSIRPAAPRVLPQADDPTQGITVLGGSGGKLIDLPRSWSTSISRQKPKKETKRQFDTERVYQVEEDEEGRKKIQKDIWFDMERVKKVRLDNDEGAEKVIYSDPPPLENVETLAKDQVRGK